MTLHLRLTSSALNGLSTRQLAALEQIWEITGLPPAAGYERVVLGAAVGSDCGLLETLSSLDLDASEAVAFAVAALRQWRTRAVE
jgi:hypothetical protein